MACTRRTAPKAKRESTAFELTASKRFSNNWQFIASAVFSKLEGNYDGTFQASTGQLDPNINSAFDYADFLVNADGKLSNDRNVQLKFDGSYEFSSGRDDRPERRAVVPLALGHAAQRLRVFARVPELGVLPRDHAVRWVADRSDWETDLHLSYPIRFGGEKRLSVIADHLQPVQPAVDHAARRTVQPDLGRRVRRHSHGTLQRRRRNRDDR